MKRKILNIIGFMMAGLFVMSVWGEIFQAMGTIGGLIAPGVIIGLFWNINHKNNLINNSKSKLFIDMAIGIGIAGLARDFIKYGGSGLLSSLPTLIIVIIGGAIGGYVATWIEGE